MTHNLDLLHQWLLMHCILNIEMPCLIDTISLQENVDVHFIIIVVHIGFEIWVFC